MRQPSGGKGTCTAVKAFVVNELGSNRVVAKVYTDEGLTGLGEGTLGSRSDP